MINPSKVFEVEEDVRAEVEARIGYLIAKIETLQGELNDAKDLIYILTKIHDPLILQYSIKDCIKMLREKYGAKGGTYDRVDETV